MDLLKLLVFMLACGVLAAFVFHWIYVQSRPRCEKDGTIMVEGTFNHLICPKCNAIKHLGD